MSNIQALNHIDHSKVANTIKFLKNEIKYGSNNVNEEKMKTVKNFNQYCKNELTNNLYSFMKGTPDEKELFRVMSIDGNEKIYFDSKDEYTMWFRKNRHSRSIYNLSSINCIY